MSTSADQLMRDLGQNIGVGDALRFNGQRCARLLVGEHLAVDFEHVADEELLQMYSVLGSPPAEGREQFYRDLLSANLFGHATQGGVLAWDPAFNQVLLTRTLELENATSPKLLAMVESFVNVAEYWKKCIAEFAPDVIETSPAKADPNALAMSPFATQMMMRV